MASIKFGPKLKEIRIFLCPNSKSSEGARNFMKNQYIPIKLNNKKLPIMVRECSATEPKLYARYEFGKEKSVSLANLNQEDVVSQIRQVASDS